MSETLSFVERNTYRQCPATSVPKRGQAWQDVFNAEGMRGFLRKQYDTKTAENVAADTGMTARNVKRWLSDDAIVPNLPSFLSMVCAYGAPFLASSLKHCPGWLNDHVRLEKLAALQLEIDRAEAELAALLKAGRGHEN